MKTLWSVTQEGWSKGKVDEVIHEAYCEASCNLDNGGSDDDEICLLLQESCICDPCSPVVQYLSKLML